MSGSKMMVSKRLKRWVVVGIVMTKDVAPVLRVIAKQRMKTHYEKLRTRCMDWHEPCTLRTLTYHQASTDETLKSLKFGNINNNRQLYGNNKSMYNYSVSSSVDLAKLYLPDYLAKFTAFDESMDMSTILRLLGSSTPAPVFRSDIETAADDVRGEVRNKWGHCDEREWKKAFYNDCFKYLERLVRSVGLTAEEEKIIVEKLNDWKTKGCQLCMGQAVDQSLLTLVQQEVASLCDQYLALKKQVGEQKRSLDTILVQQKEQVKQVEENKLILDTLVSADRIFREELMNRMQQVENRVTQLEEDRDTLGKTQDESTVQHKRPLSPSSSQEPKRAKLMEASPVEPCDVETCLPPDDSPTIELDLKDCDGASVNTLFGSITHTTLKTLSLKNIDLIPEAAVTLGRALSEMSGLEELCLVGKRNSLGPEEIKSLFGGIKETIPLHTLKLCCFSAGSSTASLGDNFKLFPDMRKLTLQELEIDEVGITDLAKGFSHLANLKSLNLSGNPLGQGVGSVVSHNTNLRELEVLNLDNTGCTEEGVVCLSEGFAHLPNLEVLYLSDNRLGRGVRSVMSQIKNLPNLWFLDLGKTDCTDEDVKNFHKYFRRKSSLMYLSLSGNPLGHGVKSVMSHITNFPDLWELDLSYTGCVAEDVEYYFIEGINYLMRDLGPHLSPSRCLDLSGNSLFKGVTSIVSGIRNFPKDVILGLCDTGCSEKDVRVFRETIKSRELQHVVITKDMENNDPEHFTIWI